MNNYYKYVQNLIFRNYEMILKGVDIGLATVTRSKTNQIKPYIYQILLPFTPNLQ